MVTLMIMPLFIGTTELILICGLALLLFGGKKLPEMMKGLGQGIQSFKKGMNEPIPEKNDYETKDKVSSEESIVPEKPKEEPAPEKK